ncbi:hypothetical protein [Novosphingobium sp. FKTRR1]|uniref:hypothetical protein n=1 Tax=Novosphingobium sp. FKTRR1 TaxID=2879118 RepID=UPI001CF07764|nr:hypothetical protein [Novosphingobium sp. FKTRR1]
MTARYLLDIEVQPSQRMQLGRPALLTYDEAAATAAAGESWAVIDGQRVVAAYGLVETYPGRQAVAWAFFAENLSKVHLALSRHARARIAASSLRRIEAVALADQSARTLEQALARPTAAMRWAMMVGLQPHCLLREYGGAGETMVFFERIAP